MASVSASTITTAVDLNDLAQAGAGVTQREVAARAAFSGFAADPDDDPVLEASRVADSAVPEGGYGWVAIGGCTVVTWWVVGTPYSWGVIQDALVSEGLSTAATLAYVGSLPSAMISTLAVVNARVVRTLGARMTAMLGVALLGVSQILSGFAVHNIGALFFTAGFLTGLGLSLAFIAISVTPAQYFSRKRGLANGVVFAGGGLGGAVTSIALDALIEHYGTAWAYRVIGILTLVTGLPAAWLIRERTVIRTTGFVDWCVPSFSCLTQTLLTVVVRRRLFRDVKFFLMFFAGVVATFPPFVPPFFLPLYSQSIGLSSRTGAALLACFNFSSAVGRIFCGLLCDRLGALNTLAASLLISALSLLALWPSSTTLGPLTAFSIINGASSGGFFATMPTVVGNVFGSQRVAVAMGMIITGWVGGYLMVRGTREHDAFQ